MFQSLPDGGGGLFQDVDGVIGGLFLGCKGQGVGGEGALACAGHGLGELASGGLDSKVVERDVGQPASE